MRKPNDAWRSLKRYTALVLGNTWEVRLWGEEGKFHLPFAYVARVPGGTTTEGSAYHGGRVTASFAIHCHPVPGNRVEESILVAGDVEHALNIGFRFQGVDLGRPMRVPLYDYDGIPLGAGSNIRHALVDPGSDGVNGVHGDYMRVASFGTNLLPDPEDDRRIAVVADIRLSWGVPGRLLSGPQAKSVLKVKPSGTAT